MQRDTAKEESDLRYDLRDAVRLLLAVLTPSTERFAAVETTVRRVIQVLEDYTAETRLAVVGADGSGKSTLINSLIGMPVIPSGNTKDLPVVPFLSETPMLRLVSGKAVACGEASCYEHLKSEETLWIEALHDRRLHAPLPVIRGPYCYRVKWTLLDAGSGTSCVLPKLSSVATRVATPTAYVSAFMIYCVDATKLQTPSEASVLDGLLGSADMTDVSLSGVQRLLRRTVFVLSHADYISDFEDDIQSVSCREVPEFTPIRTIAELLDYFLNMLHEKFPGVEVDSSQVVPFSGRNALMTKRILLFEPDVQSVYEYCETMFGSSFMQTIDDLDIGFLQRHVQRYATETMLDKSGARRLTELIRLFDFNAGKHLLRENCGLAMDCAEQLDRALEQAKPFVLREVTNSRAELECLVKTTAWVLEASDSIATASNGITEAVYDVASQCLKEFFQARLHELRYVLEGRPLVWFSERQACTIMDIKTSLNKLHAFTEQYVLQRGFLEKKISDQRKSAGGFSFLDDNAEALLQAMEREKKELLIDVATRVAHHTKDEFTRFFPTLLDRIRNKQQAMISAFMKVAEGPVTETENRIREPFDLEGLGNALATCVIVEENDRRLKNFLRELPEHVAVASVEISNQWYVPLPDDELTNPKIPSKREEYAKRLKAATAKEGDVEDESQFRMPPDLLYVLEAWRLSFGMFQLHQLCTYNQHSFSSGVAQANERILDFVNRLVVSLEEGAVSQKENVVESERVVQEMVEVRSQLGGIHSRLESLMSRIDASIVSSLDEAESIAAAENM